MVDNNINTPMMEENEIDIIELVKKLGLSFSMTSYGEI